MTFEEFGRLDSNELTKLVLKYGPNGMTPYDILDDSETEIGLVDHHEGEVMTLTEKLLEYNFEASIQLIDFDIEQYGLYRVASLATDVSDLYKRSHSSPLPFMKTCIILSVWNQDSRKIEPYLGIWRTELSNDGLRKVNEVMNYQLFRV